MDEEKGYYRKYIGQETVVNLPDEVNGKKLTVIGSKAFLSCKTVERLVLPASVKRVEDWAFAHMKQLRELVFPAREIIFGKQTFLGCDKLERVVLYEASKRTGSDEICPIEEMSGLDRLWASMFRFFPQESLTHPENMICESGRRQWLSLYDGALEGFLRKPDDTDFEPAFIGWFDVEDVDDQKQGYILKRRSHKVELVFQRLVCGEEPEEQFRKYLHSMILEHAEHVRKLFIENPRYGRNVEYYKIWQQSGGLERLVAQELLMDLPWEEPEIRGYLMQQLQSDNADYFAQLEL